MHEVPAFETQPVHGVVDYKKSAAAGRPAIFSGVAVIALCVVGYGISWVTFGSFGARAASNDPGAAPLAAKLRPRFPHDINRIPEPRLEVDEALALDKQRKTEDRLLNDPPSWLDTKKGTVRLPIAEAMRLLANPEFAKTKGIRVDSSRGGAK